ncbi:MAG: hypothetical protein JXK05_13365 [Campylobacterales bacterium]|nr:hypothetical protein [Campylobacterales bacterium]
MQNETKTQNRFLDFRQTIDEYPFGESHLRKLIFERKVPHKRIGRKIIFDRLELDSWIEQGGVRC